MKISPLKSPINYEFNELPADKSISHRAAIFALLSDEKSQIKNYLKAKDTLDLLEILKALGAKIYFENDILNIIPAQKIKSPNEILECGNSGTSMRLLLGFLASSDGFFVLNGDKYLNSRPMKRVSKPLNSFGAMILGRDGDNLAPLAIKGKKLEYFKYDSKIPSAQVKSALILAGLNSDGCDLSEPELSRDHSENMLKFMGAQIVNFGNLISVAPLNGNKLKALEITIPNDPSSAFYFALLASILKDSNIILKNIVLNDTRIEAFKILAKMGAKIEFQITENSFEKIGNIKVQSGELNAVQIDSKISWLIDEIPALSIAFALAKGKSSIKNAKELRVKESDRIKSICENLKLCGIKINEFEDGFEVFGIDRNFSLLKKAIINPNGDHRIAMSFAILGAICGLEIIHDEAINTSFPKFKESLEKLGVKVED